MRDNIKKAVTLYAVVYTLATILNSVIYLANGVASDPSGNWHEIDRAIIMLIGVLAFELITKLKLRPLALRCALAYIPSQLLVFFYVWLRGLREELAKSAYRDVFINFTLFFIIISIVYAAVMFVKNKHKTKQSNNQ